MFNLQAVLIFSCATLALAVIYNEDVEREIDLTTQLARIKEVIKFRNGYKGNIATYSYILQDPYNTHVEFFQDDKELQYEIVLPRNETFREFVVKLSHPVKSNKFSRIIVHKVRVGHVKLLNVVRNRGENQIFQYEDNIYFYSKYWTKKFNCVLSVKNEVLEITEKFHQNDENITYRVIEIKPFSSKFFKIIYVNNVPMYVVNSLERTIDVSHYGKIFVEDKVNISNAGSLLLGPYDPITNMERKWLHTYLPASSEQINFIDVLGQNTKTKVIPSTDFKSLKFQLRYPLLGGWKSKYTLQYFVPVHEYLKTNNKGEFELKMRVIDHVLNDAVIKSARTRVILPEGSQVRKITVSNMFYKCEQGLSVTSLSYSGRPTVWVFGKMLTENQILPFTISYHVSSMYFYRIPLIFTAFIQALFCIIIWLRYFKY